MANNKLFTSGLQIVALFEGAKGVLVLLVGFGLLSFIHKDLHYAGVRLVEHLHLNPAKHYPSIFINLTERVTDAQLWAIAVAAIVYSIVRFVEAVGLWKGMKWAEWFGTLTGAMYVPIEIYEVTRGLTWPKMSLLVINSCVVSYLLFVLLKNGCKKGN